MPPTKEHIAVVRSLAPARSASLVVVRALFDLCCLLCVSVLLFVCSSVLFCVFVLIDLVSFQIPCWHVVVVVVAVDVVVLLLFLRDFSGQAGVVLLCILSVASAALEHKSGGLLKNFHWLKRCRTRRM